MIISYLLDLIQTYNKTGRNGAASETASGLALARFIRLGAQAGG